MRSVWQPDAQESGADGGGVDDDTWYASRFGTVGVWVIAPGEGARLWAEFLDTGVAAIGWDDLGDLAELRFAASRPRRADRKRGGGESLDAVACRLGVRPRGGSRRHRVGQEGGEVRFSVGGTVTGDYVHDPERAEYRNTRSVDWHPCDAAIELRSQITTKALTRFTPYKPWLRYVFKAMDAGPDSGGQEDGAADQEPYDLAKAMSDLFLEEVQF